VRINRKERCGSCMGSGLKELGGRSTCRRCNGAGVTMEDVPTPLGTMKHRQQCPACGGGGVDPAARCTACRGEGTVEKKGQRVLVQVPAGCSDGDKLRVRGEGDKGARGGRSGDLYIDVKVAPSEDFHREGFDIYSEIRLDMYQAILGASVVARTIDGEAEIQIPSGTQPDAQIRLKRRGVPKLGRKGLRGDHYFTVKVELPRDLSAAQVDMLEAMRSMPAGS